MNNQEAFERSARHLAAQAARAQDVTTKACMYRAPHGLKCAIGALIPDAIYTPEFDGNGPIFADGWHVVTLINRHPIIKELFSGVDPALLSALQDLHDQLPPSDWEDAFHKLAEDGAKRGWGITLPADIDWFACDISDDDWEAVS